MTIRGMARKKGMLEWRRSQVLSLASKGMSLTEIATRLQVSKATILLDMAYWQRKSRENVQNQLTKRLPFEFEKTLSFINEIRLQAWEIAQEAASSKDRKIQLTALNLAKNCSLIAVDLAVNEMIVDEAIHLVESTRRKHFDNDVEKFTKENSNGDSSSTGTDKSDPEAVF